MLGIACLAGPNEVAGLQRHEFVRVEMGVTFRIALYADSESTANKGAQAAFARIAELNQILSDYDSTSELMRLCRLAEPGKPVKVSPDLLTVMEHAQRVSGQSSGAFDTTVGPVVRLWRRARRRHRLPMEERLRQAMGVVDYRFVKVDRCAGTITLNKPGIRLDLGGIAKGYAADEALKVLRAHGINRAMVDGSGDIVVGDAPPGEPGWRIGIAPLDAPDGPPSRYLCLTNISVATSGDAFQFVEIDGVRYSHIVDPATGLGLTTPSSVTIVARDGISADSLASAVSVLGPEKGIELLNRLPDVEGLVVYRQNDQIRTAATTGWQALNDCPRD